MSRSLRTLALALVLGTLTVPAIAQKPVEPETAPEPSPLAAAGWCVVTDGGDRAEEDPGCDVGAGLALMRWRRASVVAVIGTETVGAGVAWVAHRPESGPVIAIAAGVVVRYGSEGIDGGELYPALGATLTFSPRK